MKQSYENQIIFVKYSGDTGKKNLVFNLFPSNFSVHENNYERRKQTNKILWCYTLPRNIGENARTFASPSPVLLIDSQKS